MTNDHIWRVLIIDDSPEDREVARVMLKKSRLRFHITEAETGEAGLRACFECEEGPPDCILLDCRLPDLDGPEMLAALGGPDSVCCPVVILTEYSSLFDGRSMLHLGAQDFIGKSWINPDSLTRSIEYAIERFAMVHQLREREELSRQRVEEMEALMDSAPIGIFLSRDPECLDIRGNQVALQLYEAEPNQNLSAGSNQGEILDPIRHFFRNGREVAPRDLPMHIAVRECRKIDNDEIEVMLPSGRISSLLCSASPLFDGKGEVRGAIGTFIDITER
jgi:CheY-like chemotaxis protein